MPVSVALSPIRGCGDFNCFGSVDVYPQTVLGAGDSDACA